MMMTPNRSRQVIQVEPESQYQLPTKYVTSNVYPTPSQTSIYVTSLTRDVWDFEHPWSTNLCSCCKNTKQCCCAFFCPCCFACQVYKRAGENMCTWICPGSLMALRAKLRTAFRIQGNLFNDCCITSFCPCCASIQLDREMEFQGL